ncbi:hypothetical protein [uncultured Helicobacter sp.]|uniref:hypothetical protein n=1 Tax=uncultured Helicobacter sp. TaxID=175537 RepID=UPI002622F108|nr:hypothetical protein [uncultured Helicobacter sp.]
MSDVLQFLPALSASYSLAIKDYEGLKELAIGFGTTIGVTLISKASLNALAKKYPQKLQIALRPNHANYEGFPSGHTSSAFSAAGYMQRRYGWKWGSSYESFGYSYRDLKSGGKQAYASASYCRSNAWVWC